MSLVSTLNGDHVLLSSHWAHFSSVERRLRDLFTIWHFSVGARALSILLLALLVVAAEGAFLSSL